jgi:hypothetical protein
MRSRLLLVLLGILASAPERPRPADPRLTFNQDIARLLRQHCQECHRPGGSAPFELIKYEHAYRRRGEALVAMHGFPASL